MNAKTISALCAAAAVVATLLVGVLFSPAGRPSARRTVEPYGVPVEAFVVVVFVVAVSALAVAVVGERRS